MGSGPMVQLVNSKPIMRKRAKFSILGTLGFGRKVWVYRTAVGPTQSAARCGLEPTQCARAQDVPLWMFEARACSALQVAEEPAVDCAALQKLKALLHGAVLEDRHSSVGGADADPHESSPACAVGIVSTQTEAIDWHKLPREIQEKTLILLTTLLNEHSELHSRHSVAKESSHE